MPEQITGFCRENCHTICGTSPETWRNLSYKNLAIWKCICYNCRRQRIWSQALAHFKRNPQGLVTLGGFYSIWSWRKFCQFMLILGTRCDIIMLIINLKRVWDSGMQLLQAVLCPLLFVRQKTGNPFFLQEICHTKNLAIWKCICYTSIINDVAIHCGN